VIRLAAWLVSAVIVGLAALVALGLVLTVGVLLSALIWSYVNWTLVGTIGLVILLGAVGGRWQVTR
jgi:hypothetical protein